MNGHAPVGLYGRPKTRCRHVDSDQADKLGFDEDGQCITRLEEANTGRYCHAHRHLYAEARLAELRRTSPRLAADIESGAVTV